MSITRTSKKSKDVEKVSIVYGAASRDRAMTKPIGFSRSFRHVKSTTYRIVNNSDRAIERLYVDHTADTAFGGFTICSCSHQANLIKSTVGWARYSIRIDQGEEVIVHVDEDAISREKTTSINGIRRFVDSGGHDLLEAGKMDNETLVTLKGLVLRENAIDALQRIEDRGFTSKDLAIWKAEEGSNVLPTSVLTMVEDALVVKDQVDEIASQIKALDTRIAGIFSSQDRIRQNIKAMEKQAESDLVRRYLKDMNVEEDCLIETRALKETFNEKLNQKKKVYNAKIETLIQAARSSRALWENM